MSIESSKDKIYTQNQLNTLSEELRKENKKLVLSGGCFDILHIGHIHFLEKAKEQGDILILFLESDESIRQQKGAERPINNQQDRARLLASLSSVDFIILLQGVLQDNDYDKLISLLKPAIIATTKGDKYKKNKMRQAKANDGRLVEVTDFINNQSTTRLAKILQQEL